MSISEIDAYYRTAETARITSEIVHHVDLQTLAKRARRLDGQLRESEIWNGYRRLVNRTIWDLLNVPVPSDHPFLDLGATSDLVANLAAGMQTRSNPTHVDEAKAVATAMRDLAHAASDPLGAKARSILIAGPVHDAVLVVRDRSYRDAVESRFHSTGCPVRVVVPQEVPSLRVADTMVVIGQAKFYPMHLLNAPRARNIWILRYAWLGDIHQIEPVLPGSQWVPPKWSPAVQYSIEADFVVPSIDWDALRSARATYADDGKPDAPGPDDQRARLCLLAGQHGVYLEADSGPRVLSIDLEAEDSNRVRRLDPASVAVGDIILLRRGYGGRDVVEDVANRLLGSEAAPLRAAQAAWKRALNALVFERSVGHVEAELARAGIGTLNIRYWIHPSSIRTASRGDFGILMKYAGLGEQADEIWSKMGVVANAHQRAGMRIRKMLERRVLEANLADLHRDGIMDFELDDEDAGALTAFRVEARSPNVEEIPKSNLRDPFEVGRDYWLA